MALSPDEKQKLLDEIETHLKIARAAARDHDWKLLERHIVEAIIVLIDMRRDHRLF